MPDNWSSSAYNLNNTNTSDASYDSNTITASQWISLEQQGAVFLPSAGERTGTSAEYIGYHGGYWSSTYENGGRAYILQIREFSLSVYNWEFCNRGLSVRLVRNAE